MSGLFTRSTLWSEGLAHTRLGRRQSRNHRPFGERVTGQIPMLVARQCTDRADSARPEEPEFSDYDRDGNWASLKNHGDSPPSRSSPTGYPAQRR